MAKNTRTKQIWHIPKRGSVHQTIFMVHLINRNDVNGKSWTQQKQEFIASEMGKAALTKTGRAISHQSVRTLLANIPQYLGFVFKSDESNGTKIKITPVGSKLIQEFPIEKVVSFSNSGRNYSNNITTYIEADKYITKSEVFKDQMLKLQITNPFLINDCQKILIFPFRFALNSLLQLKYLDKQEIAYILFHAQSEESLPLIIEKVKTFRILQKERRLSEINAYSKTEEGQLTLVKAATASYFIDLCCSTGLCKKVEIKPENLDKKLPALMLVDENETQLHLAKFLEIPEYNFEDNLDLWYEYFCNPNQYTTPFNISITTTNREEILVVIENNNTIITSETINIEKKIFLPVFIGKRYKVTAYSLEADETLWSSDIEFDSYTQTEIVIKLNQLHNQNSELESNETVVKNILQLISKDNVKGFDKNFGNKISIIEERVGGNFEQPIYRGGRLEFLFYNLLKNLLKLNVIDDLTWNGKVGKYGLPVSAPGGKEGIPDITFQINNNLYVLELTTIPAVDMQWRAEGSSVPDHILKTRNRYPDLTITGFFSAPSIYPRVSEHLTLFMKQHRIPIKFLPISVLLEILVKANSKNILINLLQESGLPEQIQ